MELDFEKETDILFERDNPRDRFYRSTQLQFGPYRLLGFMVKNMTISRVGCSGFSRRDRSWYNGSAFGATLSVEEETAFLIWSFIWKLKRNIVF